LAATIAFYKGKRGEEAISLNDDAVLLELLKNAWTKYDGTDESLEAVVVEVLAFEKNWKMNLNQVEGLTAAVVKHLANIVNNGMQKAIESV
jgi:tagaturonate reductase